MAMYKARFTVYKDPAGKTLKGPTFTHLLGDICSAVGLIGILSVILALMESWGIGGVIRGVVMAVAGFALMVVLHKKAKQDAESACLEALSRQEGQTTTQGRD